MSKAFGFVAWALFAMSLSATHASAACALEKLAELPVTMIGERPVVPAKLNGRDAQFVADSGAFFSMITRANAEKYGLLLHQAPFGFFLKGATGTADVQIGTAQDFNLADIPLKRIQFLVGGSEVGAGTVGLLGQNIFSIGDVEYDLANGAIRLFHPKECGQAMLAYWVKADQAFSDIPIEWATPRQPHTMGDVFVNGVRLRAIFDTGASSSVLTRAAAARAGIKIDSPSVISSGRSSGIGRRTVQSWIAPIASFKIGDEEIKSTRLQIGELELVNADMLVGADFFLAHRVYVASSQHRLYFSYNGGKVFSLSSPPTLADTPVSAPAPTDPQTTPTIAGPSLDEPKDAAGFDRRGDAYLSRREPDKALNDLTRAMELAPTESEYVYDRARARSANKQPLLAIADLDQALKLKPDNLHALVLRAELLIIQKDKSRAASDLDAADKLASKQDDVRFQLAEAYSIIDRLPSAIAQYDLWIEEHDVDYRLPQARNGRCWARALLGQDLSKALVDCNAALRTSPHAPNLLDSRGLVFLRLGDLDKAIADYDAALQLNPKIAWSLYGRGLAKLHKGLKADGEADIAAAAAINPLLPQTAASHGLTASAPPPP